MKFKLPRIVLRASIASICIIFTIAVCFVDRYSIYKLLAIGSGMIILTFLIVYLFKFQGRYLYMMTEASNRQHEAHRNILSVISPNLPLPSMHSWTILPDAASIIVTTILEEKPRLIVECGSGISTVLCCYTMQKNGIGRIISIDHEKKYAEITRKNLSRHGFEKAMWEVYHMPLIKHVDSNIWYDLDFLKYIKDPIDFLIIDGPPHKTQNNVRYPAGPNLFSRIRSGGTVLLDDASRSDEIAITNLWLTQFKDFSIEFHNTQKGTALFRKK